MWVAVLPSIVNFRSPIVFLLIMSKPQNVKNRCVSTPSPRAALARIRPGVGHVQVALGADDRELAAGLASSSNDGTMRGGLGGGHGWSPGLVGSHAAVGLGQPGDVGHLLGRLLREQREQLLGRDAADRRDPAQRRGLALLGEVLAQEADRLPVLVGQLDADLGGERPAPGPRSTRRTRSGSPRRRRGSRGRRSWWWAWLRPPACLVRSRGRACRPSTCGPAAGRDGRGAGRSSRSSGTRACRGGWPGSP